jgi:hypothetical protein
LALAFVRTAHTLHTLDGCDFLGRRAARMQRLPRWQAVSNRELLCLKAG